MTEPSPHLDLDALADTLAGEREGDRHLASCASCTSRLAELSAADVSVSAALAALPPPRVPDDLVARLDAALAAEPHPVPAAPNVTALPARRAPQRRWLPVAAAGVLLLSGGGLGYALLAGDEVAGDAVGEAGTLALDGLPQASTGTDYADVEAVRGVLPQVLEGGPQAATEMRTEESADIALADPAPGGGDAAGVQQAPADDPLERLRTEEGFASCLSALLAGEPGTEPLAVDYAQYSGLPALAVVLPDPDPDLVSVFVVGPECSAENDALLHFVRVAKP